jgi:transcription antitermination factor NusG
MVSFPAVIVEVDDKKDTALVSVMIFGRLTDAVVPLAYLAPPV